MGGASYLHSDVGRVGATPAAGDVELQRPGRLTCSVAGGGELDPGPGHLQPEERPGSELLSTPAQDERNQEGMRRQRNLGNYRKPEKNLRGTRRTKGPSLSSSSVEQEEEQEEHQEEGWEERGRRWRMEE